MKKTVWFGLLLAVFALSALTASPAYGGNGDEGQGKSGKVVPNSYIVVLKDGVSADQVVKDHGIAKKHTYKAVFNGFSGKVPPDR